MRSRSVSKTPLKKRLQAIEHDILEYIYSDPLNPTLKAFYSPHSISVLVALIVAIAYLAFFHSIDSSTTSNALRGIAIASIVFTFYGMTQLRDGPFIRPHPVFWRAIQALSVIYLMLMIFLFFQNIDDARRLVSYLDPKLGVALPERSYATDCQLTWKNISAQLDVFVAAHTFGWYAKALILRDHWLCWIISIMFEVMEYSLAHQLPNFAECWWDHWILDVFTCNWLGIWLGMKTCEYLSMKTYNWRGIRDIPGLGGKFRRSLSQFTPHSWTSFDWALTKTLKGYLVALTVTALFLVDELNVFYLKYLLWIPPPHWINGVRITLHAFMGAVAVRETYQYFTDPKCQRLGAQAWIMILTIVVEVLICVKWGRHQFPTPAPQPVVWFWRILLTLLILFPIWQFWLRHRLLSKASPPMIKEKPRARKTVRKEN